MRTITASGAVDAAGWLRIETRVPEGIRPGEVDVVVILSEEGRPVHQASAAINRRRAALDRITKHGGLGIADASAWQRDQRQERPLPGRG